MENKGRCPHGEFDLEKGCPQCIAESKYQPVTTDMPHAATEQAFTPPSTELEIVNYYNEAVKLREYAEERIILTLDDAKIATDDLTVISRLKKAMEARRKEELRPHDEARQRIQDEYKHWMEPVLAADTITRTKMQSFNAEQERVRREQERINTERMELAKAEMKLKGELSEPVNLVEVQEAPKKVSTEQGTSGQRDNWTYEITDFALLPDDYKLPNTSALNALAKSTKGTRQIPGVRIFNNPVIVVRPRA